MRKQIKFNVTEQEIKPPFIKVLKGHLCKSRSFAKGLSHEFQGRPDCKVFSVREE